ncbi:MAG: putative rRNA maturation factor [Candidatus Shapirobacteria bacterium GW2011_GWE1_38_10]|uniref:Putative rRNA maturation factor n=1 Tax=Candidatus Shapirobacteria bacterium GW2011_GWE1_38_10 TaxID=1618488 RepID=A0A0G0LCR5_9BACT|nr:MAG: putative rRNA maturation factor [Candidatus Shapirobacteria bacterium GW2011_GWE1_38_10]HBP50854.1 rRNA maturation RNase YbeY [Candidatus Shapirobacteria bacterium]
MKNVILIKNPKNWGLDRNEVLKKAVEALDHFKLKENIELSVIFVGQKRAKELNIKYRQKDYIPQVLGFPMSRIADSDGYIRLGDVVICTQKLKYEMRYFGKSLDEVLGEWMKHGVENLLK